MRRPLLIRAALGFALAAALTITLAEPLSAGPPWIAIEYPANPHHPSTRGAVLLVRAYHHSTAVPVPVRGTAEGIVDGRRISRPLDLRSTSTPGVFALRGELPREGVWVLVITAEQSPDVTATALVRLDGRGGIASVEVPARESRDGWTVPRVVDRGDIDRALRSAAGAGGPSGPSGPVFRSKLRPPRLSARPMAEAILEEVRGRAAPRRLGIAASRRILPRLLWKTPGFACCERP